MKIICFSIFFILITSIQIFSQVQTYDYITTTDGLGDNFVRCLYEDSYGFIWIGTKDGLSRFDGYDVTTYKRERNKHNSLPSGYIGGIIEDSNNDLWIGTGNGLAHYRRERDDFEQIFFESQLNNAIYGILVDSNSVWMATHEGLCKYGKHTGKVDIVFSLNDYFGTTNLNSRVSRIKNGKDDNIWFGFSYFNGFASYNKRTQKFKLYTTEDNKTENISNRVTAINTIGDSLVAIGFLDGGLYVMNTNTEKIRKISPSYELTSIGINTPWSIFPDSKSNIWVGTLNGGLFKFDKTFSSSENYIPLESNNLSLNAPSISDIIEDKFGNFWFATHGGGVNILYKRKSFISHYKKTGQEKSLSANFISGFCERVKGEIWIATDGGGVNILDLNDGTFNVYDESKGLSSNAVLSIKKHNVDTMIISTWEGGVTLINAHNLNTLELKNDISDPNSISSKNVKDAISKGDSLYIITHGDGLNIYNLKTHKFSNSLTDTSYKYMSIMSMANKALFDEDGILWVSGNYGFYKWDGNSIKEFLPDTSNSNSISGSYVTDFFIDSHKRFWVATLDGLNLFNKRTNTFSSDFTHKELEKSIMSIIEDDYGNLWMGTNSGIIKYNYDYNQLSTLNKSDGLQGNQFFERSAYKDSDGYLYFGGENGFNRFSPIHIGKDTIPPLIFFSDLKIFYKSQIPNKKKSVLTKHINFTDEVTLDYSQKVITFEFVAIHMVASARNKYKYKLEGFDRDWYDIGPRKSATYTNLSPGKYTFRVMASNADNVWTKQSKDLTLIVLPPWYMTWWFRILFIAIFFGSIFMIAYDRFKRIRRLNSLLEEKVKIRTSELEKSKEELTKTIQTKDRFFSIIAHDLKNPMNSLLGFSSLLMGNWGNYDDEKKHKFVSIIDSSSSQLFNLMTNLLEWSRSQTGSLKVNLGVTNLYNIIMENVEFARNSALKKEISIKVDAEKDIAAFFDRNMIDTIIRNLLTNAIKYSFRNSTIKITAKELGEDKVILEITDEGIGIPKDKIDSLFNVKQNNSTLGTEREKGTGLGLLVCKEFIDINNGEIFIKSKEGEGSTFIIHLPING